MKKALAVVGGIALIESALFLWNRSLQEKFQGAQVYSLFFSPDGEILYGGGSDATALYQEHNWLWAWNPLDGRLLWKTLIPKSTYPRRLSPDGASLIIEPPTMALELWDTATHQRRGTLDKVDSDQSSEIRFTPDNQRIMACYRDGVQVWDAHTGRTITFWQASKANCGRPVSLHFTPDGHKMLVGFSGLGIESPARPIQFWDTRNGHVLEDFEELEAPCALSPSGNRIALMCIDRNKKNASSRIGVYDMRHGVLALSAPQTSLYKPELLRFVSENNLLYTRTYTKLEERRPPQTFLWDFRQNRMIEQVVKGVEALSPDRRLKAVANRGNYQSHPSLATLYDAVTGAKLRDLEGHAGR
ncbi:MAG: hypothetical protein QM758_07070 [Armatimonas sp.]